MKDRVMGLSPEQGSNSFEEFLKTNSFYKEQVRRIDKTCLFAVLQTPNGNLARSYFVETPGSIRPYSFTSSLEYFDYNSTYQLTQRNERLDPSICQIDFMKISFSEYKRDQYSGFESPHRFDLRCEWTPEGELVTVDYGSITTDRIQNTSSLKYKICYENVLEQVIVNKGNLEIGSNLTQSEFQLTVVTDSSKEAIRVPRVIPSFDMLIDRLVSKPLQRDFLNASTTTDLWKDKLPQKLFGLTWKHFQVPPADVILPWQTS